MDGAIGRALVAGLCRSNMVSIKALGWCPYGATP